MNSLSIFQTRVPTFALQQNQSASAAANWAIKIIKTQQSILQQEFVKAADTGRGERTESQ